MALDVTLDFFGLLRPSVGTSLIRRSPILDTIIYALGAAGILPVFVGYTGPTSNQNTTMWLLPQNPSWQGPGQIMLWDCSIPGYAPATPELFVELLNNIGVLVNEGTGPPSSNVGIGGSLYLQVDNGKIWYRTCAGVWTVFQTAIANIGAYITGHGGPSDPLNVNLSALEAQLEADLADKIAVATIAPITGNGLTATPIGLDIPATIADIIANGGLNDHVQVAVDGVSISGNGTSSPLATIAGGVAVVADGTTITGNGTTGNPLVAHPPGFGGVSVTSPITGNGTSGSPLGIDIAALITLEISNGGLNDNVQVAVDGTTIAGNGTTGSPLHTVAGAPPTYGTLGSSVSCYNPTVSVSTAIPGFPSGAPAEAFTTAFNSGLISTVTFNGSSHQLAVNFGRTLANTNYLVRVTAYVDSGEAGGTNINVMGMGAGDGGSFSTTGFSIDTSLVTDSLTFPCFFYVDVSV